MNYYLLALVLITLIFCIVIAKLIFKIHELYVKIEATNGHLKNVLNIVNDHVIITKKIIEDIDTHMIHQYNHLDDIDRYFRNELTNQVAIILKIEEKLNILNELAEELNAIGRTTTEQADIMLKIEEKINELEIEQPDEKEKKEGDAIESERIPTACTED